MLSHRESKLVILKLLINEPKIADLPQLEIKKEELDLVINNLMEEGLVKVDEYDQISLTEAGKSEIAIFSRQNGGDLWIKPEDESKCQPISKNQVYVPSKDEFSFLD